MYASGDRGRTRTCNLLIKSQLLCQIELRGHLSGAWVPSCGAIIPSRNGASIAATRALSPETDSLLQFPRGAFPTAIARPLLAILCPLGKCPGVAYPILEHEPAAAYRLLEFHLPELSEGPALLARLA